MDSEIFVSILKTNRLVDIIITNYPSVQILIRATVTKICNYKSPQLRENPVNRSGNIVHFIFTT